MQRKEKDNQLIFIDYLIFSRQKATTDFALLSPQVEWTDKISNALKDFERIVLFVSKTII